jgi:hypothetical protein
MTVKELVFERVDWINRMNKDMVQWRAFVNMVMSLRVP